MTKSFQLQSSSRSASSKYFASVQKAAELRVICEREIYFCVTRLSQGALPRFFMPQLFVLSKRLLMLRERRNFSASFERGKLPQHRQRVHWSPKWTAVGPPCRRAGSSGARRTTSQCTPQLPRHATCAIEFHGEGRWRASRAQFLRVLLGISKMTKCVLVNVSYDGNKSSSRSSYLQNVFVDAFLSLDAVNAASWRRPWHQEDYKEDQANIYSTYVTRSAEAVGWNTRRELIKQMKLCYWFKTPAIWFWLINELISSAFRRLHQSGKLSRDKQFKTRKSKLLMCA